MRFTLAVLLGKLIFALTRILNLGGGSAAPGLYALKLDPDLVKKLVSRISKNVVITGTNGKTTTSKMISHFASTQGLKVIRNHTGSNLERGIASTLVSKVHLVGGLRSHPVFDVGIWELDEAAFNTVAPKLNPKIVVFLNVFRDQLDRYGEIDSIIKKWAETLKKLPKDTIVLLNGDYANTKKLKSNFAGKVYQFGVKDYKIVGEGILHKKEKENLDFEAKNVKLNGLNGSRFSLIINHLSVIINLPLPGIYHIYDALAALATSKKLGLNLDKTIGSLKTFSPAFGRVEKFSVQSTRATLSLQPRRLHRKDNGFIFLIKNPAGCTQVLETIAPQMKTQDRLLLALNDNLADGTDVSWIWDVEFEKLHGVGYRGQIVTSGTRAYDLALRLKYAGFDPKQIIVESELKKAFKEARIGLKGRLFVLPTYTAMLQLQGILAKSGVKKNYWEEA